MKPKKKLCRCGYNTHCEENADNAGLAKHFVKTNIIFFLFILLFLSNVMFASFAQAKSTGKPVAKNIIEFNAGVIKEALTIKQDDELRFYTSYFAEIQNEIKQKQERAEKEKRMRNPSKYLSELLKDHYGLVRLFLHPDSSKLLERVSIPPDCNVSSVGCGRKHLKNLREVIVADNPTGRAIRAEYYKTKLALKNLNKTFDENLGKKTEEIYVTTAKFAGFGARLGMFGAQIPNLNAGTETTQDKKILPLFFLVMGKDEELTNLLNAVNKVEKTLKRNCRKFTTITKKIQKLKVGIGKIQTAQKIRKLFIKAHNLYDNIGTIFSELTKATEKVDILMESSKLVNKVHPNKLYDIARKMRDMENTYTEQLILFDKEIKNTRKVFVDANITVIDDNPITSTGKGGTGPRGPKSGSGKGSTITNRPMDPDDILTSKQKGQVRGGRSTVVQLDTNGKPTINQGGGGVSSGNPIEVTSAAGNGNTSLVAKPSAASATSELATAIPARSSRFKSILKKVASKFSKAKNGMSVGLKSLKSAGIKGIANKALGAFSAYLTYKEIRDLFPDKQYEKFEEGLVDRRNKYVLSKHHIKVYEEMPSERRFIWQRNYTDASEVIKAYESDSDYDMRKRIEFLASSNPLDFRNIVNTKYDLLSKHMTPQEIMEAFDLMVKTYRTQSEYNAKYADKYAGGSGLSDFDARGIKKNPYYSIKDITRIRKEIKEKISKTSVPAIP